MDAALAFEQGVFLVKFQKFTFSMSVLQQKSSTSIATIWRQLRWRTAGRGLPGRGMAGRMQPPPHLRDAAGAAGSDQHAYPAAAAAACHAAAARAGAGTGAGVPGPSRACAAGAWFVCTLLAHEHARLLLQVRVADATSMQPANGVPTCVQSTEQSAEDWCRLTCSWQANRLTSVPALPQEAVAAQIRLQQEAEARRKAEEEARRAAEEAALAARIAQAKRVCSCVHE